MPLTPTRRRLALWGQRLHAYLPPFSPAGLVGGHALMRYAAPSQSTRSWRSNAATPHSSTPIPLSQLQARICTSEWQPSSAPVEVIWNTNDANTFHRVTPASPEDVAMCAEYLVRQSMAASTSEAPSCHAAAGGEGVPSCSSSSSSPESTTSTPAGGDRGNTLHRTVSALREVLHTHRHLLAGAESLQTGVPLSYLLAQLVEAEAYLQWCLLADSGVKETRAQHSRQGGGIERDEEGEADEAREGDAGGRHSMDATVQQRSTRGDFDQQVLYLQEQLLATASCSAAPPLVTIVTPSQNSLASAIKAAAVTWAATRLTRHTNRPISSSSSSSSRQTVVLWRPAGETALSAVWLMVLLRRNQQRASTSDAVQQQQDQQQQHQEEEVHSSTSASSPVATPVETALEGKKMADRVTSAPLFHVLLTGADVEAHFAVPWATGVQTALHAVTSSRSSSADAAPPRVGQTSHLCASAVAPGASLRPLLLCYGCPEAQVRHLRSTLSCHAHPKNAAAGTKGNGGEQGEERGALPVVVELRTAVPTTGLVQPVTTLHHTCASPTDVSCGAISSEIPVGEAAGGAARIVATRLHHTEEHVPAASHFVVVHTVGEVLDSDTDKGNRNIITTVNSSSSSSCSRDITAVARDIFHRAILQPPFLHPLSHTSIARSASPTVELPSAASVSHGTFSSCSAAFTPRTVPGWCSLVFVDTTHAAALLRRLVQHHWKEPHYIGHSLAAPTRRGPLPTPAHALRLHEALREATTRTGCGRLRGAPNKGEGEAGVRDFMWRHVCGGFELALTATSGRGSPYVLPALLVVDLLDAMSVEQRRDVARVLSTCADAADASGAVAALPKRAELPTRMVVQAVGQAVGLIEGSVAALRQQYETAERGYGGVAGGHLLFLCRYPAEVAAAVEAAVLEGDEGGKEEGKEGVL